MSGAGGGDAFASAYEQGRRAGYAAGFRDAAEHAQLCYFCQEDRQGWGPFEGQWFTLLCEKEGDGCQSHPACDGCYDTSLEFPDDDGEAA